MVLGASRPQSSKQVREHICELRARIPAMPKLEQVMATEADDAAFRESAAFRLRNENVVAMRLATGAPCAGHAAIFEPWPGPERHVVRWFQLDSGHAVGVTDSQAGPQQVYLWTTAPEHT